MSYSQPVYDIICIGGGISLSFPFPLPLSFLYVAFRTYFVTAKAEAVIYQTTTEMTAYKCECIGAAVCLCVFETHESDGAQCKSTRI